MLLFPPSTVRRLPEGYQVFYAPQPICYDSRHSRGRAKCTMNLDEVVAEIIERRSSRVIPKLARESIRQARVAPHTGTKRSSSASPQTKSKRASGLGSRSRLSSKIQFTSRESSAFHCPSECDRLCATARNPFRSESSSITFTYVGSTSVVI
jgi:hypothetical protein